MKVTLLADPKKCNLTSNIVEQIAKKAQAEKTITLEDGVAVELHIKQEVAFECEGADIFVQKKSSPKKKLLVCDMESTIISNEFLDEIADHLGIGEKVAKITERAMNGEINFEDALKERIMLVEGLDEAEIQKIIKERLKYNDGAAELIKWCRENGVYTMLVSGDFTAFTSVVAEKLGFDEHHANEIIFKNGKLAGVKEPILGKEAKLDFLEKKAKSMKISLEETAAMGDGANDLPMLQAAGLGIAYYAKPKVKEIIKTQLNHATLAEVKYLLA